MVHIYVRKHTVFTCLHILASDLTTSDVKMNSKRVELNRVMAKRACDRDGKVHLLVQLLSCTYNALRTTYYALQDSVPQNHIT